MELEVLVHQGTFKSRKKTLKKGLLVFKFLQAVEEGYQETLIHLMIDSRLSLFLIFKT